MTYNKTTGLPGKLESMRQSAIAREARAVAQLPLWPEPKRGAPNSFIRSALFAAIQGKDRQFMKETVLASQDGIVIKYTGEQLNQADLDVWETIVHLAREQPLSTFCSFTVSVWPPHLDPIRPCGYRVTAASPTKATHSAKLRASSSRCFSASVRAASRSWSPRWP